MQDDRPVGRSTESGTRSTCTCATVGSDMVCSGGATTETWDSSQSTCPGNISRDLIIEDGCHLEILGCQISIGDDILIYDNSTMEMTNALIAVGDRVNVEGSSLTGLDSYFGVSARIYAYGNGVTSSTVDFEDVEVLFYGTYAYPRFLVEDNSLLKLLGDDANPPVHNYNMAVSCYTPWDDNYMFRIQEDSDLDMELTDVSNAAKLMYFNGTGEVRIVENSFFNPVSRGIWIYGNTEADRIYIENNLFSFANVDEDPLVYSYYAIRVESCSNVVDNDPFSIESNTFSNASTEDVLWEKVIELKNNTADGLVQYNIMNGFENNGIISTYNSTYSAYGEVNIIGNIISCLDMSDAATDAGIYLYYEDDAYLYSNWVWNAEESSFSTCIGIQYSSSVEVEGILGGTPDYPDLWDCGNGVYAVYSDSINVHDVDTGVNDYPSQTMSGLVIVDSDDVSVTENETVGNGYSHELIHSYGIRVTIGSEIEPIEDSIIKWNTVEDWQIGIDISSEDFVIYGNDIDGEDVEKSIGVFLTSSASEKTDHFRCNTISASYVGVWATYDSNVADSFVLGGNGSKANYIKVDDQEEVDTFHVVLGTWCSMQCYQYTTNWDVSNNFFTNEDNMGLPNNEVKKGESVACTDNIDVANSITGIWFQGSYQAGCYFPEEYY